MQVSGASTILDSIESQHSRQFIQIQLPCPDGVWLAKLLNGEGPRKQKIENSIVTPTQDWIIIHLITQYISSTPSLLWTSARVLLSRQLHRRLTINSRAQISAYLRGFSVDLRWWSSCNRSFGRRFIVHLVFLPLHNQTISCFDNGRIPI